MTSILPSIADAQMDTNQIALRQMATRLDKKWEDGRTQLYFDLLNNPSAAQQVLNESPNIELMFIRESGVPAFYVTENLAAAITISTNQVWPGGDTGLGLSGAGTPGYRLGIWDGGGVRLTHQEFGGRVTQMDSPSSYSDHATHVAGTMVAGGFVAGAKGMSYAANLNAWDWTNDESEMATAAAAGMLASNHSYGFSTGWRYDGANWYWYGDIGVSQTEDWGFGFYSSDTQDMDQMTYLAPYYLMCRSAGNDRNENGPGVGGGHYVWNGGWVWSTTTRDPDGGADGYDSIGWKKNAKNILTVGAVLDIPGGYTQPSDVVQTAFSSWGPTDDGRIKPDIVANGYGLLSSIATGDASYSSYNGTSMSSPNVTGSVNLLNGHYIATKGANPLSSTMKAILLHTADEAGAADGPDYQNGWGLMNTAKAALAISGSANITEATLANSTTHTYLCTLATASDLRTTMVWTDLAGTPPGTSLNPTTKMLRNDLDVRVEHLVSATVYEPWILDGANPANPATTGDNSVDNVEQVMIANAPAGIYEITVSHKGNIGSGQTYSIIWDKTAGPVVNVVIPSSGYADTGILVTIGGENFAYGATVDMGAGITVNSVVTESPDTLRVDISIDAAAALGTRDVIVTNGGTIADTLFAGFIVKTTTLHYVSPSGGNVYPYVTPATAALAIADAIGAAVEGDSVLVETATYSGVSLSITKGVELYGAWDGTFTSRDLATGKSVISLSGAIAIGPVPSGTCIVDGFEIRDGTGVTLISPISGKYGGAIWVSTSSVEIANCYLHDNSADNGAYGAGGGIYATGATIDIIDTEITSCSAVQGGAIFLENCDGSISGSNIHNNSLLYSGNPSNGGGLYIVNSSTVAMSGNTIDQNTADPASGSGLSGGGLYIKNTTSVTMDGDVISYNDAGISGSSGSGGGILVEASGLTMTGVTLEGNEAKTFGGGLSVDAASTLSMTDGIVNGNSALIAGGGYIASTETTINYNLVVGNTGTALYLLSPTSGSFIGNTMDQNSGSFGAAYFSNTAIPVINNIVTNTTGSGIKAAGATVPSVTYCNVWNNSGVDYDGVTAGTGCISLDPIYVNPATPDYHLALHSPSIDAGDPDPGYYDPDGSRGDMGVYGSHAFTMDQPEYPKDLAAGIVSGDAVLVWNTNPEPDVTHYAVYKNADPAFIPSSANFVTLVAAPDTTYNDGTAVSGMYYKVNAVDATDYAGGYAGPVEAEATGIGDDVVSFTNNLSQNHPNPFNPTTRISYEIRSRVHVSLSVYDVQGRTIKTLVNEVKSPGQFTAQWDGTNNNGSRVSTGVYFYRLNAGSFVQTKKMVMLK